MREYRIIPATLEHARELAGCMRHADVIELDALGYEPYPALEVSIQNARNSFAALCDGKVFAIFGYDSRGLMSDNAFPWMLAAEGLTNHARTFLPQSRDYINGLLQQYRLLWGWVCETNTVSIRWLSWLGFTIDSAIKYPTPGKPGFRYFHKERP